LTTKSVADKLHQIASGYEIMIALCFAIFLLILPTAAIGGVRAFDTPDDGGNSITVVWDTEPLRASQAEYVRIEIQRRVVSGSGWDDLGKIPIDDSVYVDDNVENGVGYTYRLIFTDVSGGAIIVDSEPAKSSPQLFNSRRTNVLIGVLICIVVLGYYFYRGRKGGFFYVRPIAGLQAIDEAVGRATELGKPILYSAGRGSMQRVATIASMNVLSSVATKAAEYNTPLLFPNNDPVVAAVAQEVAYEAYVKAGHPDRYVAENIFYLTDSQFGYAAAVDGIMVRQRPATNLFMGSFEAESLILAETGNSIGAIQIAGTDSTIQLSFFIVACDYVLIGEEYFAASGYLAKDPLVLSSLKGQDMLKLILGILLILGAILVTAGGGELLSVLEIG